MLPAPQRHPAAIHRDVDSDLVIPFVLVKQPIDSLHQPDIRPYVARTWKRYMYGTYWLGRNHGFKCGQVRFDRFTNELQLFVPAINLCVTLTIVSISRLPPCA